MGINCEECADGFYRRSGATPFDKDGCLPCNCHPAGTTGLCVKDDTKVHEGIVSFIIQ